MNIKDLDKRELEIQFDREIEEDFNGNPIMFDEETSEEFNIQEIRVTEILTASPSCATVLVQADVMEMTEHEDTTLNGALLITNKTFEDDSTLIRKIIWDNDDTEESRDIVWEFHQ